MVNPLPLQRVNLVNVGQTLQELKQLLLNHPVIFILLLSRCLWVPLLKKSGYYTLAGLGLLLRVVPFPLEFVLGKLPEPLRSKVGAYLFETLDLIPTPLGYLLHFGVSVIKGVLTNPTPVVRVLH